MEPHSEISDKDMQQILQLRKKIEVLEQAMDTIIKRTDKSGPPLSVEVHHRRTSRNSQPTLRALITDILRQAGKPLSVSEIYEASLTAGYHWRSQEPMNALNVKMYTDDTFIKATPGKFILRDAAGIG